MRQKSARQQALQDIKEDLHKQGKAFLAFNKSLNPIMNTIVHNYLKAQSSFSGLCFSVPNQS